MFARSIRDFLVTGTLSERISRVVFVLLATVTVLALLAEGPFQAWLVLTFGWMLFVALRAAFSRHRWRMLNWVGFSVLLALFPILFVVLFHYLGGNRIDLMQIGSSTELYLFAALLAAATFGEFVDRMIVLTLPPRVNPALLVIHVLTLLSEMTLLGFIFLQEYSGTVVFVPARVAALGIGLVPITIAMSATFRLTLFEK